jgi:hypothetical protein
MSDDGIQHTEPDCDGDPTGVEILKTEDRHAASTQHEEPAKQPGRLKTSEKSLS